MRSGSGTLYRSYYYTPRPRHAATGSDRKCDRKQQGRSRYKTRDPTQDGCLGLPLPIGTSRHTLAYFLCLCCSHHDDARGAIQASISLTRVTVPAARGACRQKPQNFNLLNVSEVLIFSFELSCQGSVFYHHADDSEQASTYYVLLLPIVALCFVSCHQVESDWV